MNNIDKRISVIVPCYNVEKTIEKCVNSLIDQDVILKEIIVVDDCSKDDTAKIAEKIRISSKIPIKIIKNSRNLGEGGARNAGAFAASGEYIIQTDSDAVYSRNYCRKLIRAIENTPRSISYGGLRICLAEKDNILKRFWDAYFVARWKLLKENRAPKLGGWAFKKKDFIEFKGYFALSQGADVDLVSRMHNDGYKNIWIPDISFEHFEPQTLGKVFKRFSRSKEKIQLLAESGTLFIQFIISSVYFILVLSGILIILAPLIIFVIPTGRISMLYLINKKRDIKTLIAFPWLYFFFKFSSTFGIFIGTISYMLKKIKKVVRGIRGNLFLKLNENQYKNLSLLKKDNETAVFISLDDFCPVLGGIESEWGKLSDGSWINKNLIKLLEKDVKVTLFTTPAFFDGKKNWIITEYPEWIKLIKSYGSKIEIACHGYDHYNPRSKTLMKEFDNTDYNETKKRISKSLEIFKAAGLEVKGIRPPGWGLGKDNCLIGVSKEFGLGYGSFASIDDGLNRNFKKVSNLYPIEYHGMINIPQNIGINDKNIENTIKYLVLMNGLVSIKMHYGDYAFESRYKVSDNFDKKAYNNLQDILNLIGNKRYKFLLN